MGALPALPAVTFDRKKSNPLHRGMTRGHCPRLRATAGGGGGGVLDIHACMWPWWYAHMV